MKRTSDNLINEIKEEIENFSLRSSDEIFEKCVTDKLNANLMQYFGFLDIHARHLDVRSNRKIIKTVNRLQKNADRNYLKDSMSNTESGGE